MISPIRHILQVPEKYQIHTKCAHIKKSEIQIFDQWKWFTHRNLVTITYLEGAIKATTFFFKTQNSSIVQMCCNSRTNYKIAQKSYAVILGIIWFWKMKTFWKCCTSFPWSVPHRHGFKESKNHNIILICAHMAWIS